MLIRMPKYLTDLLLWGLLAPLAAFIVRFERVDSILREIALYMLIGLPIKAAILQFFHLHTQSWSHVGLRDLQVVLKAISLGTVATLALTGLLRPELSLNPSRMVPILDGVFGIGLLLAIRFLFRMTKEYTKPTGAKEAKRVLIIGAGDAGNLVAREMLRHPNMRMVPIGFLDDSASKRQTRYQGIRVLGKIQDLPQVAERYRADEVLIAIPSAPGQLVRDVVSLAGRIQLPYRILPGVFDLISGRMIPQIREVDVEDLLRRDPIELNMGEIQSYLENNVVLVTGAGGSIGSEIIRQVARFKPKCLLLLGRGENSLYHIDRELGRNWPELLWHNLIADVRDRDKLEYIFKTYQPTVVFHAAAHKHVPLMEDNPEEAILNNVLGTKHLVELSLAYGVKTLVNISTDKAVNPTSVMGASKRLAEYEVQLGAARAKTGRFVSVRFGNVLGSRGSVVPLFREQIRSGGPITVTDPNMTRYFMTIPEASQLVLQAGGMEQNGAVYVLNMGEPVRIVDLAKDLIRLSGLEPEVDIQIVFSGVRPGEKLYEELLTSEEEEGIVASKYEKIYVTRNGTVPANVLENMPKILEAARRQDAPKIRQLLKVLVPTYEHAPKLS
jgi:FlaA1/EpsC-like NDP-sugar epimerase